MKTTATNRKVRELLTALRSGRLIPNPEFQRRLVWTNKDKSSFLDTVLNQYPFPEIYVAAGEVNVDTGEGTEMLVDGQQRITTLMQYFYASPDLVLQNNLKPYVDLSKEQKEAFLQYDVVVRDLGAIPLEAIRNVFLRINATRYALNAMEIQNARYEGDFKAFGEELASRDFFERHQVFSAADIRRMDDVRFVLSVAATALGGYFYRDTELEEYLKRYNDEFPQRDELRKDLDGVFAFIEQMNLGSKSRIWKKADLFTMLVELYGVIKKRELDPAKAASALSAFYAQVDDPAQRSILESPAARYHAASVHATSDRSARITRGDLIRAVLEAA